MRQLHDPHELLPKLKEKEVRSLSYSKISTADKCLTALEFSLDPRIPYITDQTRATGTSYHAGLEAFYEGHGTDVAPFDRLPAMRDGAREALEKEADGYGFEWDKGEGFSDAWGRVETMLLAYVEDSCYWPEGFRLVANELEFILPFREGWVARGILDRAFTDGEFLYLVDDKSAKKPWRKDKHTHRVTPQPAWYVRWAAEIWPEFAGRTRFVFDVMTLGGQFERREAKVEQPHIDGCMAKADRVMSLVEQGGPYPPNVDSFLCSARFCDHWDYCAFGESFDTGVLLPVPTKPEVVDDLVTASEG